MSDPGFELLCRAAAGHVPALPQDVARDVAEDVDWDAVIAGAVVHRVSTRLLAVAAAAGMPPAALDALHARGRSAATAGLANAAELVRLFPLFAAAGVPVLQIKGTALALQLYGDIAARESGDIDLLVAPEDLWRADAVMLSAGYEREAGALPPGRRAVFQRWGKELAYIHRPTRRYVELHLRLTRNLQLLPLDFATLWAERETMRLVSVEIATLPRRILPLYLCAHGAVHCWERLRWLCDLADLLAEPVAQRAALADARAWGLETALAQALALAQQRLGLTLAEEVAAVAASPAAVRLERLRRRFFAVGPWFQVPPKWAYAFWMRLHRYALVRGWRYRLGELAADMVSPDDWIALRLPDRLIWLYPILRPFCWLARWLRRR